MIATQAPAPGKVVNPMEALRASVEAARSEDSKREGATDKKAAPKVQRVSA